MPLPLLSNSYALLIAGLLAISSSVGQSENRDPHFTPTAAKSTSYMPRVIIRNMREDRAGNIWFATFGGAIRYDGKEFANFSEEVGLAKTRIFSLLEARSGALWFGSITGGASRYDGKSFKKFTEKEGLGNNDVMWIFEDRDANIWFGTGNGVSRYDGKSMTNFTTKEGLVDNSVYTIAQDASGRIWFGTQGGVCSYDGKSFSNLADQVGRPFVNVRSMVVDRSGNLWFGGQEGAFRYDGKTLATFTSKEGLLDDFVGSMIIDRAGNLWFGHPGSFPDGKGGGASRYDGKSLKRFTQKEGLSSLTVYCMLEDKAGNIWFGSADAGACRYDGKTFTNFSATNPPRLPARPAQAPANDQTSAIAKGEAVSEMSKSIWSVFQDKLAIVDVRHTHAYARELEACGLKITDRSAVSGWRPAWSSRSSHRMAVFFTSSTSPRKAQAKHTKMHMQPLLSSQFLSIYPHDRANSLRTAIDGLPPRSPS
jgi:ligand-binding sensor domain-containing protein